MKVQQQSLQLQGAAECVSGLDSKKGGSFFIITDVKSKHTCNNALNMLVTVFFLVYLFVLICIVCMHL